MPRLDYDIVIDRPPEEVWAVLGDLTAVTRWVPGVATAEVNGARRICTMEQGGEVHEEIVGFSDEDRRYGYTQPVHPLGFERSEGTLAVEAHGEGARIVWNAEVEFGDPAREAQFLPLLEQGYPEALRRLKQLVERS
jgi:uncharacterized protein YndB with AHSA1/START domain